MVYRHPFNERAAPWLQKGQSADVELCVTAHSLAELYSTLTNLPLSPRLSGGLARQLIRDNVDGRARIVEWTRSDYQRTLDRAAELHITGGTIYDALIARTAEKLKVDVLLTFNVRHFRRVWPQGIDIIQEP